jgi:hypothetical protein
MLFYLTKLAYFGLKVLFILREVVIEIRDFIERVGELTRD